VVDLVNPTTRLTVAQALTGSNGNFASNNLNLIPGTYTIQEESQSNWLQTSTPASYTVTIPSGGADVSGLIFGNFQEVRISGTVFNDLNGNGVQDPGEPGLQGWTVDLIRGSNTVTRKTGLNGDFTFVGVGPGSYTIQLDRVEPQSGYVQTSQPTTYSGTTISGMDVIGNVFGVSLVDVPPTATLSNNGPANEGSAVTVSLTNPFDPSQADTLAGFHYAFALDKTNLANATYANSGTSASTTFTFDDDGSYTAYGRILSADEGFTDYSTVVQVNTVAPTATLSNNGPVNEGSAVTVSFTNPFEPSVADTQAGFHYAFALDPGTLSNATYANSGTSTSASFTFDDDGSYTVYGRILNEDGAFTDYSTVVQVNTVAPTATLSNNGPADVGSAVRVSFTNPFEPSQADTQAGFHYAFALDPATLAQATYSNSETSASITFTFNDVGSPTVYGRILNEDGAFTDYFTVVQVNRLASLTTLTTSTGSAILGQQITLTATVQANSINPATPTGSVDFVDTTTSTDLGAVALSGGLASFTTSSLAVGNDAIEAFYSGDSTFLPSIGSLTQSVQYSFSGFLPPLEQGLALASNRTVPIKFQLTDYNNNFINSLSAVTALQVIYPDSSSHDITGLRYDSTDNQFIANWSTKGLMAGSYSISLSLLDGTNYTVPIQIIGGPPPAGLTTNAAGGTNAAPGGLIAGDIDLYVDNANGDLTLDEIARIRDAVTAVDAVTEPYGVAVTEVADFRLAGVTLSMNVTSAVGGYDNGVLGCTTDAGQITIIAGWNFYAGSDFAQITSAQYDFQTVVTHELGHALGLGHSTNSASVMFATLNPGTYNRVLRTADLNVTDSDTTGACGLHAAHVPAEAVDFSLVADSITDGLVRSIQSVQDSVTDHARQAGLDAVLTDWPIALGISDSYADLNDTPSLPGHVSKPVNEQDEFWASIASVKMMDRVTDLTVHLVR
jgi:hypothetical protein